ncbi:MAG: acylphosphatase [Thermodesulfovibrionales bacterium]
MKAVRAHLLIEGRVQGVFYRAFTKNVALKLGLQGWVRNNPDGKVEAVFEGDRQLIEQTVQECRRGPFGAKVEDISLSWGETPEGLSGFEIRY